MNRRKILATTGSGLIASIAGCGSTDDGGDRAPTDSNPPGEVSKVQLEPPKANLPEGWMLQTPNTEPHTLVEDSVAGISYEAFGHTRRYENTELRERVREELFDRFDRPLVVGFATHVELEVLGGGLTESIILRATDHIEDQAEAEFRAQMEEFGLQNVSRDGDYEASGSENPTGFREFTGTYPIESVEIDGVDIPNVDENSFTLESGELEITGLLGVHRENDRIFITGGVFPNENYFRTKAWEITGSVHLDLTVDLGLSSSQYRSEVVNFAKSIHV